MKTIRMISREDPGATVITMQLPDEKHQDMIDFIVALRDDGSYMKSAGARVFDKTAKMQKLIDWIAQRQGPTDGSEPATERQIQYLHILKVVVEPGLSKRRASQLIEAAKSGNLGSYNGFYTDGSN